MLSGKLQGNSGHTILILPRRTAREENPYCVPDICPSISKGWDVTAHGQRPGWASLMSIHCYLRFSFKP